MHAEITLKWQTFSTQRLTCERDFTRLINGLLTLTLCNHF